MGEHQLPEDDVDGWKAKWAPAVAALGQDISDGTTQWGADRVEMSTLRRFIEPLEINTLIHTDPEAAAAAGYPNIVAPATAALTHWFPPMWEPGQAALFSDAQRNAQPTYSPINNDDLGPVPQTKGFFATDIEVDFLRPVELGELLGRRGQRLLSCDLKETAVGRGAFMTLESEIVSDRGDVVARMRIGTFAFDPKPTADESGE